MDEISQTLFQKGVLVKTAVLRGFLKEHLDVFQTCKNSLLNAEPIDPALLLKRDFLAGNNIARITMHFS